MPGVAGTAAVPGAPAGAGAGAGAGADAVPAKATPADEGSVISALVRFRFTSKTVSTDETELGRILERVAEM